jgi:hypothetical protein
MTVQDEILIKVGMDSSQLANATLTAIKAQREAAANYKAAWNEAITSVTTAQAMGARKQMQIAKQQFDFWKQQAQGASMVGPYIFNSKGQVIGKERGEREDMRTQRPESWSGAHWKRQSAGGAVGNVVGNLATGGGLKDSLEMAGGIALGGAAAVATEKAIGHAATSTIVRESLVLIREALRGNFTRMAGSATILLNALGATAATWISAIPVIGAGAAGIIGNIHMRRQLNSGFGSISGGGFGEGGKQGSNWAFGRSQGKIGNDLGKYIQMLHNTGQIGGDEYSDLMKRMHTGGMDNSEFVQRRLMQHGPFMKAGDVAQAGKMDELGFRKSLVGKGPQQTWMAYEQRIFKTMGEMRALDKDSTAYKQKQLELAKLQYGQAEATNRAAKEQAESEKKSAEAKQKQATAAKELADKQDSYNQKMEQLQQKLRLDQSRAGEASEFSQFMPSVDDLAQGFGFMTRAKNYAKRLWLNSNLRGTAQDLIRSQLAVTRDSLAFGVNSDAAMADRDRVNQLRGTLAGFGVTDTGQKLDALNATAQTTTDAITTLTNKATRDGIVIKAGN